MGIFCPILYLGLLQVLSGVATNPVKHRGYLPRRPQNRTKDSDLLHFPDFIMNTISFFRIELGFIVQIRTYDL